MVATRSRGCCSPASTSRSATTSAIQRSVLDARNGIDERGLGLRREDLTANASFDRQRLGLKLQDLGIDRQGNALKLAGLGIDRKDNTSERGYITRLRELAGLSNTNASNRISFEGQDKARSIKSNYITGGTTFSPGPHLRSGRELPPHLVRPRVAGSWVQEGGGWVRPPRRGPEPVR
jgi:hypothetical protein